MCIKSSGSSLDLIDGWLQNLKMTAANLNLMPNSCQHTGNIMEADSNFYIRFFYLYGGAKDKQA